VVFAVASVWYATPAAASNDAPPWMHALTSAPLPAHDEKTEAVLLYAENIVTVQPNGKFRETERRAYKILRPGGRKYGEVGIPFTNDMRITGIRGWCIPAQGKDFEVKEKDTVEHGYGGVSGGELVTDLRVKAMTIPAAEPGNIIGYEVEQEEKPMVMQDEWSFQERMPVAYARYTLQLPPGWEYKAVWLNHAELTPTAVGSNQWQWEVKDVPEFRHEEDMPPMKAVVGMMIVSMIPPGGVNRPFKNWEEMGVWYTALSQGRRDPSPEIKQKVAELTGNSPTQLAKMQALAAFMQQDIRYVAIELGIGGQQPHAARDVFAHKYGDCKDKATLLSSMLKEIGVDSDYVLIHTRRGGVNTATPPHAGSFNHAILAIHLPEGMNDDSLVATIQHPKYGRLLFFDPTDEYTPLGHIRGALQANYGLMVTADGGELTRLPQLPDSSNGVTRTASLKLDSSGALQGSVRELRVGDQALYQRMMLRDVSKDSDRIKPIEGLMANSLSHFEISNATVTNLKQNSQPFGYNWTFVSLDYAKNAGGLLLVRPRVIGTKANGVMETKEPRKYPVEFPGPERDSDTFEIKMPAGYEPDDLPAPVDVDYSFGSYHSKVEAKDGVLRYTRTFEIKELSVPVEKTDDLKRFYRIIASDERNTAVLKPVGH
jgi:Domain of Unknown Function with PDB structure (DUF3857)/Transglutaminase-like superfamily